MKRFVGKKVLVTGAGSGIGKETALAFAREGADLVLCDIDERAVLEVAKSVRGLGVEARASTVDVANRDAMRAFAADVHREMPCVDVLINNAGVALGGGFLDTTLEDWDWIVSINLLGVVHGCHFFVPPMVKRGSGGHVVNVSSAAGYVASATLAAYATTKFGVFGLSEALRDELRRHRIGVSTICPGLIDTPITTSMRGRGKLADPAARARLKELYRKRNFGPEKVALAIVAAVAKKRSVVPVTPEAWAMYVIKRIAPGLMASIGRRLAPRMARAE